MKAFTYRYMYQKSDSKDINVFFKTGSEEEHTDMINSFQSADFVESCIREYVCEYDTDFVGKVETVKKSIKENIENEEN